MEIRNSVRLIGHLGSDPIVRETKNGKVARFSLATTDYYRENNGTFTSKTDWHNIVAWGANAEKVELKCRKGTELILSGKLTSRTYEDQNKVKHYVTEVLVKEFIARENQEKQDNQVVTEVSPF